MFTFQMRAYAFAHFAFDDHLTVTWPDAKAVLLSEYTGGEGGRAYPVTIFGEIRGEYPSIEEAETRLANSIGNTLPIVAANAGIADPLAVAVYGIDLSERQTFLGYSTPRATEWFPPGSRRVDVDATYALMAAVGQHPQTDLLHRAIESYRRAVGHWVPEQHVMAGEFLFISAETLSRFILEARAEHRGITPKNLVRLYGAASEKQLRAGFLRCGSSIATVAGPATLGTWSAASSRTGFATGQRALVEWPARVGVLDDLGLRVTALLHDEVPVVSLDDLFGLEDFVAVENREPAWILADGLIFGAGELNEPVAAQSAALADEGQQAGGVLADLHPLVDLAEGRLVHGDALLAFASHA
jgi:hypothetical protein